MKTPRPARPARTTAPKAATGAPEREPSDVETLSALCTLRAQDPFAPKVTEAINVLARRIAEKVLGS